MIDLRSDFLTRPTTAMLEAMHAAAVRPAVFGLREDPDQRALEREVAELLGMQDALLFPTCSMANEVALMLLARPGETVLAQPRRAHPHLRSGCAGSAGRIARAGRRRHDAVLRPQVRGPRWRARRATRSTRGSRPSRSRIRTTAVAAWHARAPTRMRCWQVARRAGLRRPSRRRSAVQRRHCA